MSSNRSEERVQVSAEEEAAIQALYDRGLYHQAWRRAQEVGPVERWAGEAQLLAARLANNLFAPKLARRLTLRAWREHRGSCAAAFPRALSLLSERGPYLAWRFLQRLPAFAEAPPAARSTLLTAHVAALCAFRDFDRAGAALLEAEALGGDEPWLGVTRARWLQQQDRYAEALEATDRALALHPWYRPAVQQRAELLQLLERDGEAADYLAEASEKIESPAILGQLVNLQLELERPAAALESLQRLEAVTPEIEPGREIWLQARLSDTYYALGDLEQAARTAALVKTPFFERLAERLADPARPSEKVRLPIPFVRQHHMTCAPATISALSRYQRDPIDHLSLAEVVCYDGTPPHLERHWLLEQGWVVREFCVTWEILVALLDRGVAFALATVETQSAHLQAVVGYDRRRGTLFIRDPYEPTTREALGDEFLERYTSTGPRGMVFLRPEEAHRLDGLELPEVELYDLFYGLERAVFGHARPAAVEAVEALAARAPGHRLALEAQLHLAVYDASRPRQLAATQALLALYPGDGNLLLARLTLLREMASRAEYRTALQEAVARPKAEPIFWRVWAEELLPDARQHALAQRLLLRTLRYQPTDADTLSTLAKLQWQRHEFVSAAELHRLAACVQAKREEYARDYLLAARHLRRTEEPLALFQERFRQQGHRSAAPAQLLFWSLSVLHRLEEAFAGLEEALRRRPEDGDLQLFAADAFARYGQGERATALLEQAKTRSRPAAWLRTAALLADYRCDLRASLGFWQQILLEEPLAMQAHAAFARLLAELEGSAAAREHLRQACLRFPHYGPLRELAVEWNRSEGAGAIEPIVLELLQLDPASAWAHRELALLRSQQRRPEEAAGALAQAQSLEINSAANFRVAAKLAEEAHRLPEAREHLRAAVRLSVDQVGVLYHLLEVSESFAEKRESIDFLRAELIRQVVLGEGLLSYRELAYPILDPEELLTGLREAQAARPDLWHAWVALAQQLGDMRRELEALAISLRATELFPLHAQTWLQLSSVRGLRAEQAEQLAPLQRALLLAPAWGRVSRTLAEVQVRQGEATAAEQTLERAIANAPLEAENHLALGELRWRAERREEALANAEHALRLEPGLERAWQLVRSWSSAEHAVELAQKLTEARPGEARSWLVLAQSLPPSALEERLTALRKVLELATYHVEAYDLQAVLLAEAGRFDEAQVACAPAAWKAEERPYMLAGRGAWVEAMRGHLPAAIATMEMLVQQTPSYYWGWNRLTEWYAQLGRFEEARGAAKQMLRLVPQNPVPLGYVADVLFRLGEEEEGLTALRRALALDPEYFFAARGVFELELKARDYAAAERAVEHIRRHTAGPWADACRIRLLCAQKRVEETADLFRDLCLVAREEATALDYAAETLMQSGYGDWVEQLCEEVILSPQANSMVGRWWVERMAARGDWKKLKRVLDLDSATPLGEVAYQTYLQVAGDHKKADVLRHVISKRGLEMTGNTTLWGAAGYGLLRASRFAECIQWMRNWAELPKVTPCMLANFVLALRQCGRHEEAKQVSLAALDMPRDQTTHQHQLWIAGEEIAEGDPARAGFLLQQTKGLEIEPFFLPLQKLIQGSLRVLQAGVEQRKEIFSAERKLLRLDANVAATLAGPALQPLWQRSYRRLARDSGSSYNPLWFRQKIFRSRREQPSRQIGGLKWIWVLMVFIGPLIRLATETHGPVVHTPSMQEVREWSSATPVPSRRRTAFPTPGSTSPWLDQRQPASTPKPRLVNPGDNPFFGPGPLLGPPVISTPSPTERLYKELRRPGRE